MYIKQNCESLDLPRKSIGPVFPGRTFSGRPPLKGCPQVTQPYCNAPAVTIPRVPSKETCYVYVVDNYFHQLSFLFFLCIRIITKPRLRTYTLLGHVSLDRISDTIHAYIEYATQTNMQCYRVRLQDALVYKPAFCR